MIETTPKISVIIPVYNVADYVENCILSVLNQTYQDFEIIIVDDCGSDNSMEIVKNTLSTHLNGNKATIITHTKNKGVSAARNTGIMAAKGEYLTFVDSDDAINTIFLEEMIKPFSRNKELTMTVSNTARVSLHGKKGKEFYSNDIYFPTQKDTIDSFINNTISFYPWGKMINRFVLINNNLFFKEGVFHEDLLWRAMLLPEIKNAYITSKAVYSYYVRKSSTTHSSYMNRISDLVTVYKEIKRHGIDSSINNYKPLFYFYEKEKTGFLISIFIRPESTFPDKKRAYYAFRKIDYYKRNEYYSLIKKASFIKKLTNIHYVLPVSVGFWYLLSVTTVSKILKII